jgi:hypothetical protein
LSSSTQTSFGATLGSPHRELRCPRPHRCTASTPIR